MNAVINTSLDGVIISDDAGQIIEFSPAAEEIFGHRAEDVIGHELGAIIVPDHMRAGHNAGMERMREGGEKRVVGKGRVQLEAKRADGSIFPVELAIQSAVTEDGDIFIAFLRDITQQKADEAELVDARDKAIGEEPYGRGYPRRSTIFDDFVTGNAAYDREVGGTGLGLSIAKRFVDALGGEILVASELGLGSTFRVVVPAKATEAAPKLDDLVERRAVIAPLRVLVVEDNEINRFVVREMLQADGHEVKEAQDGQQGYAGAGWAQRHASHKARQRRVPQCAYSGADRKCDAVRAGFWPTG
ncbi:hypothetical protein GQR58_030729 [Nymphon striatum]|nr:hypothetical protein GQR58_030729 [Nymphon striatum]